MARKSEIEMNESVFENVKFYERINELKEIFESADKLCEDGETMKYVIRYLKMRGITLRYK